MKKHNKYPPKGIKPFIFFTISTPKTLYIFNGGCTIYAN